MKQHVEYCLGIAADGQDEIHNWPKKPGLKNIYVYINIDIAQTHRD